LRDAGLETSFRYLGSVDRAAKLEFLGQLDLLSVPTTYREPKGRYVLEALAAGVPVVQPDHGAFPELLAATGGGQLVPAGDSRALAEALHRLLTDDVARQKLGRSGQQTVHQRFNAKTTAEETLRVLLPLIE
jgi:glycosyltransferase involved in cell wall biosynthesis